MQAGAALAALVALLSSLALASAVTPPYVNAWIDPSGSGESFLPGENTAQVCSSQTDMFPSKIGGISAAFSIEYRNTYKILTNKVAKTVYVLYQRGCAKPTVSGYNNITAYFQVPLTSVAVESPFDYWPIFHYMGEKQAIRFVDAPALATDNACIHKQQSKSYTKMNTVRGQLRWDGAHWISNGSYHVHPIGLAACQSCSCTANGSVGVLTNTSVIHNCNATKGPCSCRNGTHHAWLDSLNIEATFTTSPCSGCKGEILISDQTEESFLHTGEWSQYIAAFFNREKEVTALAQTVAARWNTESEGVVTVDPKPKVLVLDGYHTSDPGYSDGWYLQTCKKTSLCPKTAGGTCAGERWCHLIRSAGGNPMNADLTTDMTTENKNFGFEDGSVMGISHKELVIWAKDVDVVIMKSGNLSEADMRNLLGEIGGIAAVGNKRVYDTLRKLDNSGRPTFWGHAQIEPNVFMQDVIKIVNGVQSDDGALPQYNHTLVFFRNLLKETMGDDKRCADEANANFKKDRLGCIPKAGCTDPGCLAECTDNFAINDILYWVLNGYEALPVVFSSAYRIGAGVLSILAAVTVALML